MNLKIWFENKSGPFKLNRSSQLDSYSLVEYLRKRQEVGLLDLAKDYDSFGYLSPTVGQELERFFGDDAAIVGIHRTGFSLVTEDYLNDVFQNGLIHNNDGLLGVSSESVSIEKTVSFFPHLVVLVGQLKGCSNYKNSEGCLLVKIPKSYLGQQEGEVKPIYFPDSKSNVLRLLPEFIYGYVPVSKSGVVGEIKRNPQYKEEHTYDSMGLLYDTSAIRSDRTNVI